jgi:hypothetical protein
MPKANYIAGNDDAFAAQLNLFKNNIGGYSAVLGLTPAQIAAQAADANCFTYTLQCQEAMQNGAQQWTSWKDLLRDGGTPPMSGAPVAPTLPVAVPPVTLGVEVRFRALVKQIKANTNYNEAMGEALGIEGAQQTAPDLTAIQPVIDVSISGGRVEVDWGWQGNAAYLDQCELQVDRGDGKGFALLAFDTTPGYVDTQPFPAAPVKWTYKAIYRVNDAQTGQWSNLEQPRDDHRRSLNTQINNK